MAQPGNRSPWPRPGDPQCKTSKSPDPRFSSRIESFTDLAELEFGGYYQGAPSPPRSPSLSSLPSLRGRESLVSLATQQSGTITATPGPQYKPWNPSYGRTVYQEIQDSRPSSLEPWKITQSRDSREHAPFDNSMSRDVTEGGESMDIALIPAAAAIDGVAPPLSTPTYTDLEISTWREQEKAGNLSNGLGAGLKPPTTIREVELLLTTPVDDRLLSPVSLFYIKSFLSRAATRKALGQSAADRAGQAVQVIIEDADSDADFDGHEGDDLCHYDTDARADPMAVGAVESKELAELEGARTGRVFQRKAKRTETFYPHPDWKPVSMRWPYLSMLILISVTLGGLTESLYQSSTKKPLVSFNTPQEISPGTYFVVKFLPTILAVLYGVLWQITDLEVRRLKAYYQLSKEGGATSAETLNVDYITDLSFLRPLYAYQLRHYAVMVSSMASLLAVSAVPTLTSACIILTPDREIRTQNPDGVKKILLDPTWSRILEVVFYSIAVMGAVLFYQLQSRRSGLLADVRGIAGLAAMANVSHILMDFKDMDVATHEDIHKRLADKRYVLRNSSLAPLPAQEDDHSTAIATGYFHLSLNPHPLILRAAGCVPFITGILLFTALLPIFLFTPAGYLTDKAPWVATALAVCIKLAWGALDTNVRMMEPFFILYKRHAAPKTLTLDYTALPFGWVALCALANGHWLVFAVSFGSVMTEVLTVLVTSLAAVEGKDFAAMVKNHTTHGGDNISAGQETADSFWISLSLATFILLYMGTVCTVVFLRRRRPFLPRQPNTIASVLAFIYQSKMLWNFVGTEKLGNREIVDFLKDVGETYGLGWFEGRDGKEHCGIDQEELKTSYRHGLDYSRSNKPWVESVSEWL
ncbi:spray [Diaporthe helianthi]|uniref:Spray n=1 Tax=Diaporthe helianthi TaxID=158607 RepID=A0A2P5I4R9_DIAHE|nr:spray [Diaporthe helianthi]